MVLSMLNIQPVDTALIGEERDRLINEVIDQINSEFTPAVLSKPNAADRLKVEERVVTQVANAYRRRSLRPGPQNKHLDEANPSVNAKLPSTEHNPGGGRIKVLHPVTALPIQDAARLSPGTGISSMQFVTALRQGILIPWHKHQSAIGLHKDVGGIDFVSMYPGIMVRFNISPEVPRSKDGDLTPASGEPGIVPQTLAPLLEKRIALKTAIGSLHPKDCRREVYKARASAEKWLLVTCFGYLGYKNYRFGRIEAHEAVTAYGREALLRAKEAAEDLGFTILHMYVDGLWVQRSDCARSDDFQALLAEVSERTGLPIALDGIYRWVVFLPSRVDKRIPVPNRYFGVFQDGYLSRCVVLRLAGTTHHLSLPIPKWVY